MQVNDTAKLKRVLLYSRTSDLKMVRLNLLN